MKLMLSAQGALCSACQSHLQPADKTGLILGCFNRGCDEFGKRYHAPAIALQNVGAESRPSLGAASSPDVIHQRPRP
jgi:hypothetical protein